MAHRIKLTLNVEHVAGPPAGDGLELARDLSDWLDGEEVLLPGGQRVRVGVRTATSHPMEALPPSTTRGAVRAVPEAPSPRSSPIR